MSGQLEGKPTTPSAMKSLLFSLKMQGRKKMLLWSQYLQWVSEAALSSSGSPLAETNVWEIQDLPTHCKVTLETQKVVNKLNVTVSRSFAWEILQINKLIDGRLTWEPGRGTIPARMGRTWGRWGRGGIKSSCWLRARKTVNSPEQTSTKREASNEAEPT